MKKFIATEVLPDGTRGDVDFEAEDWAHARRICEENNLDLDGELYQRLTMTRKEAEELIASLNERKTTLQ